MRTKPLLMLAALLLPSLAAAGTLVVLNKSDHEAVLLDGQTLEVISRLPTGQGPHEAAASPDGRYVYVANYGAFAVFRESERPRMQPGNTITVLDLQNRTVKATWNLGEYRQPHGIWVSRDGSRVWVTCEGNQVVLELDAATGNILKSWTTGQQVSHMVVPTPDERKLYVANIGSGSVTVINRSDDSVKTIPTGAGAEGIDVLPDGREVWVTNRAANTISILRVADDTVVATLPSGGEVPIRLKFTPDGRQAWVSNARSNTITVFDVATRTLLDTIAVGAVPVGLLMTPDGRRVFVANTNANQITVIDLAGRRVLHSFTTGNEPDGMAWAD
ncbi:MAG: YncE family protein [Firmicutes bacterium]|nr:YncE family protein [Bacillota bacterium]